GKWSDTDGSQKADAQQIVAVVGFLQQLAAEMAVNPIEADEDYAQAVSGVFGCQLQIGRCEVALLRLRCVQFHHRKGDRDRKHRVHESLEANRFAFASFEREYRHLTLEHFERAAVAWPGKCRVECRKVGVG